MSGNGVVRVKSGVVGVYVDVARERARAVAREIAATARSLGFGVAICDGQAESLDLATPGATLDGAAVLATIGGDGTLLRAAQVAGPLKLPIFGVNTGRVGFLTEVEGSEAGPALAEVLRDGFVTDERATLAATTPSGRTFVAVNEVALRRAESGHMMPFGLFVDGNEAAHVPADGLLVATPTGSTAYFLSAGGPILAPNVDAFGIVALLPHTLFTRPLVVPTRATIELVCDEQSHATLEVDGETVDALGPGDRVVVRRGPWPVLFARRHALNFFAVLEDKMRWNAPIKGVR